MFLQLLLLCLSTQLAPYLLFTRRHRPFSYLLSICAALAYGLSLLLAKFYLGVLQSDFSSNSTTIWLWLALSSMFIGFSATKLPKRFRTLYSAAANIPALQLPELPLRELNFALLTIYGCTASWIAHHETGGFTSPLVQALIPGPILSGLCTYFGASLSYLLDFHLHGPLKGLKGWLASYEFFISQRFLLSKTSKVLSLVTTISITGVALGVALVLISLAILSGFEADLENKIIGANAHIRLQPPTPEFFNFPENRLADLRALTGLRGVTPLIEGEIAIASQSNYAGGVLFGVDLAAAPHVFTLLQKVLPLNSAEKPPSPPPTPEPLTIIIGSELAKILNVQIGEQVRLFSPLLVELTPVGMLPKSLSFKVSAIFNSQMYEYDARYIYTSLTNARKFFNLQEHQISSIEMSIFNPAESKKLGEQAALLLNTANTHTGATPKLQATDWQERHQTLFTALKLEKMVAFLVLTFIILVASFSIVNTLSMSIIEKRAEIALLKTLGATDISIMQIFLVAGLLIGALGLLIGMGAAGLVILLLKNFGFGIPGEIYYINSLPVSLQISDVLMVSLAALLIIWNFAVFPALKGSKLPLIEGLKE